eukprot:GDKJ01029221.1.p1 GENE.GDKJ01029221.1~~GDKJ01029221.1.p1  ORF type:complete len:512 (-),score=111.86 GDKJ01029221.1:669-2204(-)
MWIVEGFSGDDVDVLDEFYVLEKNKKEKSPIKEVENEKTKRMLKGIFKKHNLVMDDSDGRWIEKKDTDSTLDNLNLLLSNEANYTHSPQRNTQIDYDFESENEKIIGDDPLFRSEQSDDDDDSEFAFLTKNENMLRRRDKKLKYVTLHQLLKLVPALTCLEVSALQSFDMTSKIESLDRSFHAKLRKNPRKIFEGCKTISVLRLGQLITGNWTPFACPFDLPAFKIKQNANAIDLKAFLLTLKVRRKFLTQKTLPLMKERLQELSKKHSEATILSKQNQITEIVTSSVSQWNDSNNKPRVGRISAAQLTGLLESHRMPLMPFLKLLEGNAIGPESNFITAEGLRDAIELVGVILKRAQASSTAYALWSSDVITKLENRKIALKQRLLESSGKLQNQKTALEESLKFKLELEKKKMESNFSKSNEIFHQEHLIRDKEAAAKENNDSQDGVFIRTVFFSPPENDEKEKPNEVQNTELKEREFRAKITLRSMLRIWKWRRSIKKLTQNATQSTG